VKDENSIFDYNEKELKIIDVNNPRISKLKESYHSDFI
jgi:hypothetical protein